MKSTVRLISPAGMYGDSATEIPTQIWDFPGGELGVRITEPSSLRDLNRVMIDLRCRDSDGILAALLLRDAVERVKPGIGIDLYLPYLPYGRQDRVCNPGESKSVSVLVNMLSVFDAIYTVDHHPVFRPDNVYDTKGPWISSKALWKFLPRTPFVKAYPDHGAWVRHGKPNAAIVGYKKRDPKTGNIQQIGINIPHDITGKTVVIIDDICDGGGTFIPQAKALKEAGAKEIILYVSHGIFSRGTDLPYVDKIITTDSYYNGPETDKVKVYELLDLNLAYA